jgi:hypothetical protein
MEDTRRWRPDVIAKMQSGRVPFHLSLRTDDPFEKRLITCIKRMPRGYAKLFFIRITRLFASDMTDQELYETMIDFVVDVRPMRLRVMPDVMSAKDAAQLPKQQVLAQAPRHHGFGGTDDLSTDVSRATTVGAR